VATLALAPTYKLPQACANGQVAKWNSTSWACAADSAGPGTVTSVAAGYGLVANGPNVVGNAVVSNGLIELAYGYILPQGCTAGQVPKSDGNGTWTCSTPTPKFINLSVYSALLSFGATLVGGFGPITGINVPSGGAFAFGFTIPPDYTPGTPLSAVLVWNAGTSTSCNFDIRGNFFSAARPGGDHIQGFGASDGITFVGGGLLIAPAIARQAKSTTVTISSPVPGVNFNAGDAINFGLFRSPAVLTNPCATDFKLQGISITYQ
jgi:hypothetical protein